jgi:RNA polymerase sigma-70 factor (ECF subfamily)
MGSESKDLVAAATRGDAGALESLLVRHLPGLHAFVRLRMGEHLRAKESSSDLVQSVCREVLQDLERFEYRDEGGFKQWLYTRALRKILNRNRFYRAGKRDLAQEAAPAATEGGGLLDVYLSFCTPSRDAMAHERIAHIEAAFAQLPESFREVITLARVVGLSHQEIGEKLGKSEGAARVLLHRALARLSLLLAEPPAEREG